MSSLFGCIPTGQAAFGLLFIAFFIFRYLRTFVGVYANLTYKPIPVRDNPTYGPQDFTVIIPTTFKNPAELTACVKSILNARPAQIIIVTSNQNVDHVKALCRLQSFNVRVIGVERLNKRVQMVAAIKEVRTKLIVFADDDVFWNSHRFLHYMAAAFENENVGAAGPRQRLRRSEAPSLWSYLGTSYLERRVFNNLATIAIDGSISTLSGRTSVYRAKILQDPSFLLNFLNDYYRGQLLNSDDDKCLTRWVYSHGWEITIQSEPMATLETNLEEGPEYIEQCFRWQRARFRGNFLVMSTVDYWYKKHLWGFYYIYATQFFQSAVLNDLLLGTLLYLWLSGSSWRAFIIYAFNGFTLFMKQIKMIAHFRKYPSDMNYIPAGILFSYYHSWIFWKSLFSLSNINWDGKDLKQLEKTRAEGPAVVPMLKEAINETRPYKDTTPGRLVSGEDYFTAAAILA